MKFIASVFEFHTGPHNGMASIWIAATDNEHRRTLIPIELEEEFQRIGPFPYEVADQISLVLKSLFKDIGMEYVELATSDD